MTKKSRRTRAKLLMLRRGRERLADHSRVVRLPPERMGELARLMRKPRREIGVAVEKRGRRYFVIMLGGGLVSVASVSPLTGKVWKVGWLYTRPPFRNRGLAKSVLSAAVSEALGAGASSIFARVGTANLPALAVFRRVGFEQVGHRDLR